MLEIVLIFFKNIYILALTHATVALLIRYYLPPTWHNGLVFGPRFYTR